MGKISDRISSFGGMTFMCGVAAFVAFGFSQWLPILILAGAGVLCFLGFLVARHRLSGELFFAVVGLALCLVTLASPWYEGLRRFNRYVVVDWWQQAKE